MSTYKKYKIDLSTSKPSAIIDAAINDLETLELRDDYEVDMGYFHKPNGCRCHACLAGAVIAHTTGYNPDLYIGPEDFDNDTERVLDALDDIRRTDPEDVRRGVSTLLRTLRDVDLYAHPIIRREIHTLSEDFLPYDLSPERFKAQRRALATILRRYGY